MRASGIDIMGTSPTVMASPRQMGKSVLSAVFDEWVQEKDRPKEYLKFSVPPLAVVLSLLEEKRDLTAILETLITSSRSGATTVVDDVHLNTAKEIYSYFTKKHTLRRIKNDFISDWMQKVDHLAETPLEVEKDDLKILVTLPRAYEYNKEVDNLTKNFKSVPNNSTIRDFESELEFVKKVSISQSNHGNGTDYFWKTPAGHLMRIRLLNNDLGKPAWDCLAQQKRIKIKTIACAVSRVKGYDFYVLQPDRRMEVNIA